VSQLAEILKEDMWKELHPATKLVVKVLQHIKGKLEDGAEIQAYFEDDEILVTTYKSEIRISKKEISFKRKGATSLRVQRIKLNKELSIESIDEIKKAIIDILEYGYEPNYQSVVKTLEYALHKQ